MFVLYKFELSVNYHLVVMCRCGLECPIWEILKIGPLGQIFMHCGVVNTNILHIRTSLRRPVQIEIVNRKVCFTIGSLTYKLTGVYLCRTNLTAIFYDRQQNVELDIEYSFGPFNFAVDQSLYVQAICSSQNIFIQPFIGKIDQFGMYEHGGRTGHVKFNDAGEIVNVTHFEMWANFVVVKSSSVFEIKPSDELTQLSVEQSLTTNKTSDEVTQLVNKVLGLHKYALRINAEKFISDKLLLKDLMQSVWDFDHCVFAQCLTAFADDCIKKIQDQDKLYQRFTNDQCKDIINTVLYSQLRLVVYQPDVSTHNIAKINRIVKEIVGISLE